MTRLSRQRLQARDHSGFIRARQCVGGFTLTDTQYGAGLRIPKHTHERGCFALVLDGCYTETFRTLELECGPANVVYRPPNEPHSDRIAHTGSRCFLVEMDTEWLRSLDEQGVRFDGPVLSSDPAAYWLAKKIHDECASSGDALCSLSIQGLMLALAATIVRVSVRSTPAEAPRWLQGVVDLLRSRCPERPTLTRLAKTANVHPVHLILATAFRQYQGCTIGDYVRQLRIERACQEMRRPEFALADIAFRVGFANQSHFGRAFKRVTGMSPARFRAAMSDRKSVPTSLSSR